MFEGERLVKTVLEKVGVLSMFVKNDFGDLNITDFTVENSGFAHDINTLNFGDILEYFGKDEIGGETERIIDVENQGFRLG